MNILSPNNETHSIIILPRFLPVGELVVTLYNPIRDENTIVDNTYIHYNGYTTIITSEILRDNTTYNFKVENQDKIIYRGSLKVSLADYNEFYGISEIIEEEV